MSSENITHLSFDTFSRQTTGKQVVLLYPRTTYRPVFLTHMLNANGSLLYFRIVEDAAPLHRWLSALAAEFTDAPGGFGSNLQQALDQQSDPATLGNALAEDLNLYPINPTILFLDELDRLTFDATFQTFVEALVVALDADIQLVVSARQLAYQPWYGLVASGRAVVLGTERRKDQGIFSLDAHNRPRLEVYAFGRGHVLVNGQPVTSWDGALPRNLFFYFMDRPLVTRDEIFATFWPDLPVKEATNVFHVTKRKISERLSEPIVGGGSYELTRYSEGFYRPGEKLVRYYDAADLQAAVERAMTTSDLQEEERLLQQAIALYRLPYLETIQMDWAVQRREQLRQLYAQALIGMGRIHKRRDDCKAALGFFLRAVRETPEREDIHREIITLYLQLEKVENARLHYQHVLQIMKDQFGITPSKETRALYRTLEASG
jgi:two-component SAPR family response regulator